MVLFKTGFHFGQNKKETWGGKKHRKSDITHIMTVPPSSQTWGPRFHWCGLRQPKTKPNLALQYLQFVQ